jgi:hypothetical protein
MMSEAIGNGERMEGWVEKPSGGVMALSVPVSVSAALLAMGVENMEDLLKEKGLTLEELKRREARLAGAMEMARSARGGGMAPAVAFFNAWIGVEGGKGFDPVAMEAALKSLVEQNLGLRVEWSESWQRGWEERLEQANRSAKATGSLTLEQWAKRLRAGAGRSERETYNNLAEEMLRRYAAEMEGLNLPKVTVRPGMVSVVAYADKGAFKQALKDRGGIDAEGFLVREGGVYVAHLSPSDSQAVVLARLGHELAHVMLEEALLSQGGSAMAELAKDPSTHELMAQALMDAAGKNAAMKALAGVALRETLKRLAERGAPVNVERAYRMGLGLVKALAAQAQRPEIYARATKPVVLTAESLAQLTGLETPTGFLLDRGMFVDEQGHINEETLAELASGLKQAQALEAEPYVVLVNRSQAKGEELERRLKATGVKVISLQVEARTQKILVAALVERMKKDSRFPALLRVVAVGSEDTWDLAGLNGIVPILGLGALAKEIANVLRSAKVIKRSA